MTNLLESDTFGNFVVDSKAGAVSLRTNGTSRLIASSVQITTTLPLRGQNGTVSAPAFSASADTNTGVYFPAADTVGVSTNGIERFRINSQGELINNGVFYYNARTISADVTLSATSNAMSIGPLVINDGVVVTVPDGGSWSVM